MKNFSDLTEQELLALAIALEEEDSRTYSDLADALREMRYQLGLAFRLPSARAPSRICCRHHQQLIWPAGRSRSF